MALVELFQPQTSGLVAYTTTIGEAIEHHYRHEREVKLPERWRRKNYHLIDFVEEAWDIIEPQPFVSGWHIEALCQHLEAVTETAAQTHRFPDIRNLLVNVPPRTSKSLITAVFWNAWVWIEWPAARFLYLSYSRDLALRDAGYCRDLMLSDWYQSRWGEYWHFTSDQNVKSFYSNSQRGYRVTTSVGAMATGFGGDFVIGDDLHSVQEDLSTTRAEIEAARGFWLTTIPSRVTNAKTTCKVVIGQRVAIDDVSDAVIKLGTYEHLKIPMEYEPEFANEPTALGWEDPRTEEGELLCPERFGDREVAEYRASLGHRYFSQYQQRPVTEATSLFPRTWWKFYHTMPDVDWFDVIIQSWDMRFKDDKDTGSYVAGHVWGRKGSRENGEIFLLDRVFARLSFTESAEAVESLSDKWPGAYAKLIENKANGPAIFNYLRTKVFGLLLVEVDGKHGSKYARAEAVAMVAKARRAWLPHPELCPWVEQYMDNMERFPADPTDDTDATSQAWNHLVIPVPAVNTVREQRKKQDDLIEQKRRRILEMRAVSRTGV